jgi:hypothetical protein
MLRPMTSRWISGFARKRSWIGQASYVHFKANKELGSDKSSREFFRLLGYYVAYGGFKPAFRDYLAVPSPRVKLPSSWTANIEDVTAR